MKALVSDAADPQRTLRPFLHNAGLKGNSLRKNSPNIWGAAGEKSTSAGTVRAVGLEPTRAFRPSAF
jgi:hypothetical protein